MGFASSLCSTGHCGGDGERHWMLWNDVFALVGSGVLEIGVPGSPMCQELPPETCGYTEPISNPFPVGFRIPRLFRQDFLVPAVNPPPVQVSSITLSKAAAPGMLWLRRLHSQPGFACSHRGRGFASYLLKMQVGLGEKHRVLHVSVLGGAQRLCCRASRGRMGPSLLQCLDTSGKLLTHHKMMRTVRLGGLGNLGINRGFVLFILEFHGMRAGLEILCCGVCT